MKLFEITLKDKDYTILPIKNGSYHVYNGLILIGSVTPSISDEGIKWTGGQIGDDLAKEIGKLIEEYEM